MVLTPWRAIAAAVLLVVAACAVLDVTACVVASEELQRSCVAVTGATSLYVQARVRQSPSHRVMAPAVSIADVFAPRAIVCEHAAPELAALTSRQRLARLTALRI